MPMFFHFTKNLQFIYKRLQLKFAHEIIKLYNKAGYDFRNKGVEQIAQEIYT